MSSRGIPRISSSGGGGGPPPGEQQDRFSPKYLVGNTANGDSAIAFNSAGFVYFADPGNGSGIAAALAAAAVVPGNVGIRPGTFDLNSLGAPGTPLFVPSGVEVYGAGRGVTSILARQTDEQGVFQCDATTTLADLSISASTVGDSFVGSDGLVVFTGPGSVRRCDFVLNVNSDSFLRACIISRTDGEVLVEDCTGQGDMRGGIDSSVWTSFVLDDVGGQGPRCVGCTATGFDVTISVQDNASVENLTASGFGKNGVLQQLDGYVTVQGSLITTEEADTIGVDLFGSRAGSRILFNRVICLTGTANPIIRVRGGFSTGQGGHVGIFGNYVQCVRDGAAAIDIGSAPSNSATRCLIQGNQIVNNGGVGVALLWPTSSFNSVQNNSIEALTPVFSASGFNQISGNL